MRFLWRSVRREKWEVYDVAVSCGTPKLQPCPPRNWEPEAQPPSSQRNLRSSLLSGIFLNRSWLTDSTRSWSLLPVSVYVTTSLCCPGVFVMFTAMSLEHSPGKTIEGKNKIIHRFLSLTEWEYSCWLSDSTVVLFFFLNQCQVSGLEEIGQSDGG